MNNYEKILKCAEEEGGYITSKKVDSMNINSTYLSNLVNDNKLERVGNGVYKLPEYMIDNLYILSNYSKNMCYSHATALYLHGLSDRIPLVLDVTVPYNYNGLLSNNSTVNLRYVKNDIYELGLTKVKTENNLEVNCYDIERTICDIVKDKNKMDKELYVKALKEYVMLENKDLLKLIKYAKILKVDKEITELMEVLL